MYVIAGLTGLHGVLIAKSAFKHRKQAQSSMGNLLIELNCAGLLVLACLIMLTHVVFKVAPVISFFCGWLLAAIATLPLVIIGVIKVITAIRQKQRVWRKVVRLVLNCFALLIYLTFALWMSMLLVMLLSGEPYMGN
ncbi:hypothetical protein H6F75_05340 [Nodosilinea sp. FACHB-131]|uniref:hypothetical protein n=1 Tax=Cyanophyceae TaxID=3028117 RepID=UPI0016889296|nr:hypothetical protein [Nodosilinea sp. FACHB-131]MBD1872897.1 hypothetical protein [Nodosilinea sp. FACHB-131]